MKLNRREKAILTLLIREVQDDLADKKLKSKKALVESVGRTLDAWVRANDLHPESAEVMSMMEFRRWLKKIEREETECDGKPVAHRSIRQKNV